MNLCPSFVAHGAVELARHPRGAYVQHPTGGSSGALYVEARRVAGRCTHVLALSLCLGSLQSPEEDLRALFYLDFQRHKPALHADVDQVPPGQLLTTLSRQHTDPHVLGRRM